MENLKIVTKEELFARIKVQVGQLHCEVDNNYDFRLCGSVSSDNENMKGYFLLVKANFCDAQGNILFVDHSYDEICFANVPYDSFSIICSDLRRYLDVEKLCFIEIYPYLKKESKR